MTDARKALDGNVPSSGVVLRFIPSLNGKNSKWRSKENENAKGKTKCERTYLKKIVSSEKIRVSAKGTKNLNSS